MNCPKCGKRMVDKVAMYGSSTLLRETGSGVVSGLSCWNCGKWIEYGVEIKMPMPEIIKHVPKPKVHVLTQTDEVVWEYRDSIKRMLKQKTKEESILKLLRRACKNNITNISLRLSIQRLKEGVLQACYEIKNSNVGTVPSRI